MSGLSRFVPGAALRWPGEASAPAALHRHVDGTLVFVDVSGFTALSERLAQRGKVGAEQLTDVLNSVFGTMLGLAAARGGSLLKFGGDALFLLFTGPDHAVQAACATVEMRAALAATAKTTGPAGRLRLRMSVGVHTGEVDLFLVGASHRELVIVGPATTAVASMEAAASAGQILVGPDTAAALPAGAVGDPLGPGYLLRWRRAHADPGQAGLRAVDDRDVSRFVPTALRAVLGAGDPESEHRTIGVSFVRYTGIDTLLEQQGHQATAEALHLLVSAAQSCADTEGVTFLATDLAEDGGKVILVAGFPTTADDDQGRLLRASRHVVQRSLAEAWPIGVRAGLNRGHVFAGAIGSQERATVTVMGDTVNLAARVMAKAETGQVLATPATLDNAQTLFATHPVEPFMVKGKSRPVTAYLVEEETGTRPPRGLGSLPFLGRETELTTITAAIDALAGGRGGVVSLVGDAGMGKTRLLREALTAAKGITTLQARAEPYGAATPYRPVRDPLRRMLGVPVTQSSGLAQTVVLAVNRLTPDLMAWVPLIGDVLGVPLDPTDATRDLDPQFRPDRTADAIIRLLEAAVAGPLVVAFDDVHYSDDATAQLAARFEHEVQRRPWLLLLARRDEDTGYQPTTGTVLPLGALSNDTIRALVENGTAAAPLRPHDADVVVGRVGGNPLFLEETLANLREHGDVNALPSSLEGMVAAQLDALPPLARRVVRRASVLGRSFRVGVLQDLFQDEPLVLDDATRRDVSAILEPDGHRRLRFRHAMLRDVAYDSLPYQQRRTIHRLAAESTLRRAQPRPEEYSDSLALHYWMAGEYSDTWRWSRVAAEQARTAYANEDAATQLRRALAAARRASVATAADRAEASMTLGDVLEQAGRFEEAIEAYRDVGRLVDLPTLRLTALSKRARVHDKAGHPSVALRETTLGMQAARAVDDAVTRHRLVADLLITRALALTGQGRYSAAHKEVLRAEASARQSGSPTTIAVALNTLEETLLAMGRPSGGTYSGEALTLVQGSGDLRLEAITTGDLGMAAFYAGRWDEAAPAYERSGQVFRRIGDLIRAATADANLAEMYVLQNRAPEARPLLEEAIRVFRSTGRLDMLHFAEILMARVLLAEGDVAAAQGLASDVSRRMRDVGALTSAIEADVVVAEAATASGAPTLALAVLDDAIGGSRGEWELLRPSVERARGGALAAVGRTGEAAAALREGRAAAQEMGMAYEAWSLTLSLATVDDIDDAEVLAARVGLSSLGVINPG